MAIDPYVYPGTSVLKNKLDLRDPAKLQQIEYSESGKRAPKALRYATARRKLDEQCWRGIHRTLFSGIYSWAGKYRTVELSKGTTAFAPLRALKGYADRDILPVFSQRIGKPCSDMVFAAALAECWGELNFLHPFREGNGRATQIFVTALAQLSGRTIDWSAVDRPDEIAAARAAATQDYEPYAALLLSALRPL